MLSETMLQRISSLLVSYECIGYFNIVTGKCENQVVSDELKHLFPEWNDEELDYNQRMTIMADRLVVPEDRHLFLKSTSKGDVLRSLLSQSAHFVVYRVNIDGKEYYYQTKMCFDKENRDCIVIGTSNVDDAVRKTFSRYEQGKSLNVSATILSEVSHSIRTSSTSISGMVSIARKNIDNPEKVEECISKIENASQQLVSKISGLPDETESKPVFDSEEMQSKECCKGDLYGKKVLLAEDDKLNMEIAQVFMEDLGIDVTAAEDGMMAVNLFTVSEEFQYDAIVMDISMPVMDGLEATREIRAMDRADAASIPIIAMTANAFEEDFIKAREAGMNAHLVKPVDYDLFTCMLKRFIRT